MGYAVGLLQARGPLPRLIRQAHTLTGIGWVRGENSFLLVAARVFGLCGFVVAAPLLDLLGANPTFFVAHNVDGQSLVLFGLVVTLIPAAIVIAALGGVRLIARQAFPKITAVLVGALAALAVVPIIDRTARLSTVVFLVLLVASAVGVTWAYQRWSLLRTYTSYLAPAPILFLVIFLFVSPSSVLLNGAEKVDAAALRGSNTPIVVVTFDEFPLGVLLDANGELDAARYPGFARLASLSTWYPKANTVAAWTHLAVPALLTGQLVSDPVPVAATHPRSLFTLFDNSHHLEVSEAITQLCPSTSCKQQAADDAQLAHDTEVVFLHSLLPDGLAEDWLPEIGERWSGFDDGEPEELTTEGEDLTFEAFNQAEFFAAASQRDEQPGRFQSFLSSIKSGGDRPGLWFEHSLLPHLPYHYLPDLRPYDGSTQPAMVDFDWVADNDLISGMAQRLVLQTVATDRLVSQMLDRLEEQGLLDNALIVVTADHGVTFETGRGARGASPATSDDPPPMTAWTRDDMLPVPLFIKYPGESTGVIDNRAAQIIDVMPTIVDSLGLTLPAGWHFDGESLLGKPSKHRDVEYTPDSLAKQQLTITGDPDPLRMARYIASIFTGPSGSEHDLYRLEPYGALIGQRAEALVTGGSVGTAVIDVDPVNAYDNVTADTLVPALFEANVTGVADEDWLAIAVDGTIAGVGPVYLEGPLRVLAMLDPAYLTPGSHRMTVYRIDSTASLRPLTMGGGG